MRLAALSAPTQGETSAEGFSWTTGDSSPPEDTIETVASRNRGCRDVSSSFDVMGMQCRGTSTECCDLVRKIYRTPDGVEFEIVTLENCETQLSSFACSLAVLHS